MTPACVDDLLAVLRVAGNSATASQPKAPSQSAAKVIVSTYDLSGPQLYSRSLLQKTPPSSKSLCPLSGEALQAINYAEPLVTVSCSECTAPFNG